MKICCIGNPLIDIIAPVDDVFLQHHGLPPDGSTLADSQEHPVFGALKQREDAKYLPGGTALNTIRFANWIIDERDMCTFIGCVGKDEFEDKIKNEVEKEKLDAVLIPKNTGTGICAVCVNGSKRSLVSCMAAATKFSRKDYDSPPVQSILEKSDLLYLVGFTVRNDATYSVFSDELPNLTKYLTLAINLSSEGICQNYFERIKSFVSYSKFIFANLKELLAFGHRFIENSYDYMENALILKISAELKKISICCQQFLIITQETESSLVISDGQLLHEVPILPVDPERIVDTNGAGDAFVGGFLAGLHFNFELETCVKLGHAAAAYSICKSGAEIDFENLELRQSLLSQVSKLGF